MIKNLRFFFSNSVRVRYAPSPTGLMHLGAVRTALFNYMFARKNQGKFILRIEDTDTQRNVKDGAQHIYETLTWLGITPDQSFKNKVGRYGPYTQSQRVHIYKQIEQQLLKNGYAYPCFCSHKSHQRNQDHTYDGTCRRLTLNEVKDNIKAGKSYSIRIKSDIPGLQIEQFEDANYGNVKASSFDDFIIVKSNGIPTYHFANVIDDWKMGITHVIRGAEWLTNTSKHIYLYKILKINHPVFFHLPLIFTADGKKLSKRDPSAPIDNLRKEGYLAEGIINYTGLLGSQTENKLKTQFLSLDNLCQIFQPNNFSSSPIKSDIKKLNFFNRYYMRQKWHKKDQKFSNDLIKKVRQIYSIQNQFSDEYIKQVIECLIDRINKVSEIANYPYFFRNCSLNDRQTLKDLEKLFGPDTKISHDQNLNRFKLENYDSSAYSKNKTILHNLLLIFEHVIDPKEFNENTIGEKISGFILDNSAVMKNEDIFHLLRVAIIGRKSGPNIIKICRLFGRQRVVECLKKLKEIIDEGK